jgi:5-dehydro-4-deoxyglucarate dehydratase
MTAKDVHTKLKGVFGFPITPFRQDLSLDLEGLERNVAGMMQYPFCAIVAAGGTGEIYSMTVDEIVEVVRVTVKATGGKMPVVAGTGYNAAIGADLARKAEKAGADCILALPPYYINAPESGLFDYYQAIGKASGLPLFVYSRDWAVFSPQQVARLAEKVPTLAGWKDGQGIARKYQRIMNISNLAPKVSLALAEAGIAQDFPRLNALMAKYVHPLYALRERMRGYEVAVVKEAMEMLGMPAGPVRPPLTACRAQDVEDLRKLVAVYRTSLEAGAA